jgi:hypothetical protein
MNKLITGVISAVGIIAAVTATVSTASASVPVTKVQANILGWSGMSVRPAGINFGEGGAPFITGLHWSYWDNGTSAYAASGTLHQQVPGCTLPVYKCKYASEPVTVYLHTVKDHRTLHYFYAMTVKFRYHGTAYREAGVFKPNPGATEPNWIFRAVWPYL